MGDVRLSRSASLSALLRTGDAGSFDMISYNGISFGTDAHASYAHVVDVDNTETLGHVLNEYVAENSVDAIVQARCTVPSMAADPGLNTTTRLISTPSNATTSSSPSGTLTTTLGTCAVDQLPFRSRASEVQLSPSTSHRLRVCDGGTRQPTGDLGCPTCPTRRDLCPESISVDFCDR